MKKIVFGSFIVLIGCFSCKSSHSAIGGGYTINGKIDSAVSGEMILCRLQTPESKPDTAYLSKDGSFTFKGTVEEPIFASIYFPGSITGEPQQAITFFAEPGSITINARKDSLINAAIVGGACNEDLHKVLLLTKPFGLKMAALSDSMRALYAAHNETGMQALQERGVALEKEEKADLANFIKGNPKSYVATYLAYSLNSTETDVDAAQTDFNNLDATVKESFYGKKLKGIIDALKSTAIGTAAPQFTANNLAGQSVSLASFKGKYLLLDFWASWCGPCRQENPNVVKAYAKFKNKNFTIVGFSLDDNKDAWQQAVDNDKLGWNHLSDLKGWSSAVAALYNVQSIPANFLLDPNGIIIAKNLRGADLEDALTNALK